jgi:hypothetical protein
LPQRLKLLIFSGLYTGFALSFGPAKAVQRKRCRAEPGERFLSLTASVTLRAGLWPFKWLCHLWLLFIAIKSNSPLGRNSCPQGKELALAKRHPQDKYLQFAQKLTINPLGDYCNWR